MTPASRLPPKADGKPETPTVFTALKGKPKLRLGHIAFGLTITILGWAQIRLGLEEWVTYSDSGNTVRPFSGFAESLKLIRFPAAGYRSLPPFS